jgi:uncharacterized OB-fold protein
MGAPKYDNIRRRVNLMKKKGMEIKPETGGEKAKINNNKKKCKHCGHEAFYDFNRCPECDKEQN